MCSPIGHSLIGSVIGSFHCRNSPFISRKNLSPLLLAVIVANIPDLDYLPGIIVGQLNRYHHGWTHSLVGVAVLSVAVWGLIKLLMKENRAGFLFIFALLLSHLAADMMTIDEKAPYGIPLFWPFSDTFLQFPFTIFPAFSKHSLSEVLQWVNVRRALYEIRLLLPLLAAAFVLYRRNRLKAG